MLTRIAYRIVAAVFFLMTVACVLVAVGCLIAQIGGHYELIPMGLWAAFFAWLLGGATAEAWRTGRYDPLFD
jgi:hypothetical protein